MEVDKYYEYYNIKKIVNKQSMEIKREEDLIKNNEEMKNLTLCRMCEENNRNVIFEPCLHLLYCNSCVEEITSNENLVCPVCESLIVSLTTIVL
jgi:hypothetical protein